MEPLTPTGSPLHTSRLAWPDPGLVDDLARLRRTVPLVHCITNGVVAGFTANVLLAVGASPAMVPAIEEVDEFVRIAGSLLVNVGTVTSTDAEAMLRAAATASETGTPWVLDPVAAGALTYRTGIVSRLLRYRPSVIRGNASEILAVSGLEGASRGVDATVGSADALPAAVGLARRIGTVVAVSGKTDFITDGKEVVRVDGGHEIMTKVTGMGCTLGALIAAMLPVTGSSLRAASAASAVFAAAGELAAGESRGPGSFAVAFLDRLSSIGTR